MAFYVVFRCSSKTNQLLNFECKDDVLSIAKLGKANAIVGIPSSHFAVSSVSNGIYNFDVPTVPPTQKW